MSNPYLSNSSLFGKSKPGAVNPYGGVPQGSAPNGYATTATPSYDRQFAGVEEAYYGPAAGPAQTGRLTYDDVIMKTAGVVGLVVLSAAAAWMLVPPALAMPVMIVGLIGGFILGLVNAFKKEPSPALILAYAVLEGAFLGVISEIFESSFGGIVAQAVLATFVTFGVTLALYKSGKVRVTPKFRRFMMIGLISYAAFCLINLGAMLFFSDFVPAWGIRGMEVPILGIPLGLLIGPIAIILAAMCLIMDFDTIHKGVQNGLPRKFAWAAAFGITVTLIWLYIEFLRLLAILRGGD
ncbi:Bax inhibitor-1/YccA family protein [Ruania halotolerans]|uniref:Bax inhibitor-1/YccA family protein n=1 Tax=Ruania halotolerans TaxID=2897773 RepID=UPI001E462B73|nr:Bax inhibitor-1/YccA family protein [Ruania halotolerans]UFU07442.1 Bax inhibitor-1/YccA family protein [Ruania halotolerans]